MNLNSAILRQNNLQRRVPKHSHIELDTSLYHFETNIKPCPKQQLIIDSVKGVMLTVYEGIRLVTY